MLVTLSGNDPDNFTLKVFRAIRIVKIGDLEIVVVLGGNNPYCEKLQFAIQDLEFSICLRNNVTNISSLMAWSGVAIFAGLLFF